MEKEMITSAQNPKIKRLLQLQQKSSEHQILTVGLNAVVLVVSLVLLYLVRGYYMSFIYQLFPELSETSLMPAAVLGVAIWAFVSSLNYIVIRRKITLIWKRK